MSPEFPLHSVPPPAFHALRKCLEAAGYTEQFLLSHFGAVSLHELLFANGARRKALDEGYRGEAAPVFFARFFFGGQPASPVEIRRNFSPEVHQALIDTGLLDPHSRCPVLLHPAFGLFITSDRTDYAGGDFVMCGSEGLCRQFLRYVGTAPCGRFLDMGTGSGIAAMLAASYAREVWAVDIVERAVEYARFNCALNGIANVRVLQGDLFSPVEGIEFDRIASNPPFEPALTGDKTFSCGGEDGEAILARLVAATPAHLAPGGRLYCQVLGTDRKSELLDRRVLRWLGPAVGNHDTALFPRQVFKPLDYAAQQVVLGNEDASRMESWSEFYARLHATSVVLGHLIVQKHSSSRASFHLRGRLSPDTEIPELEALLRHQASLVQDSWTDLRLAPKTGWELQVRHRLRNGELQPVRYSFTTQHPLTGEWDAPAWMARVVSRANGEITAGQHLQWAEANAGVSAAEFQRQLAAMVWAGVLNLPATEVAQ